MKQKLKRISRISLYLYLVIVPISLLFVRDPTFRTTGSTMVDDQVRVVGTLRYVRGGEVKGFGLRKALVEGIADFSTKGEGLRFWSDRVMEDIESGRIVAGKIKWWVNWDAVLLAYVNSWLIVAFGFWFFSIGEKNPKEPEL